jgi:hypothetical protein
MSRHPAVDRRCSDLVAGCGRPALTARLAPRLPAPFIRNLPAGNKNRRRMKREFIDGGFTL